jgi:signal transduction histidine kinase
MGKHGILFITNGAYRSFPSQAEIESSFTENPIVFTANLGDRMNDINNGDYGVLVLGHSPADVDRKKLEFSLNYLKYKPSIVCINDDGAINQAPFAFSEACIHIKSDENLKTNLVYAIDAALKRYRLAMENAQLQERLDHARTNNNIVELTLAYNHEMNNLLTTIIGNTQLMLKQSADLDDNTVKKLEKIGINAQKIREMAINLINIINSPVDSMPLNES